MLSKIKLILWLTVLVVVAYFVAMNNTTVTINLLPGYQTVPVPLSVVIIFSITVGAVIALIFTIGDWIKFKLEISKLSRELQNCQSEKKTLEQKLTQTGMPNSETFNQTG